MLKKIIYAILILLLVAVIGGGLYLKSTAPQLSGHLAINILDEQVDVYYDDFGVPHIYANNELDAYKSLGYVHAQDRLFQMDMIRRLASGRLSEFIGPAALESDKYFRTIGIRRKASEYSQTVFNSLPVSAQNDITAYLKGVNYFIKNGKKPIEYKLLDIPEEEFTVDDIYTILGYMGLGFTTALRNEPIIDHIVSAHGEHYLEDWNIVNNINDLKNSQDSMQIEIPQPKTIGALETEIPLDVLNDMYMPIWYGSNAWVISGEHTANGQVLFANDTHIGISQPAVWYETHLNYPGHEMYGNFLAGVPFAILGHTRDFSLGLTIFPFDAIDLYEEKFSDDQKNVLRNNEYEKIGVAKEVIKVKGQTDKVLDVQFTSLGPFINDVSKGEYKNPISMWWLFLQEPTTALQALYGMNYAKNIDDVEKAVSKIDFLGLNVVYGDKDGNIAHWGSGKILKRPSNTHGKFLIDGSKVKNHPIEFYDFSDNPQWVNPSEGFIVSANDDPGIFKGEYRPGYYCPPNRANRIIGRITEQSEWTQESMKSIHKDEVSDKHQKIAQELVSVLKSNDAFQEDGNLKEIIHQLENWDGAYGADDLGPTIYNMMIFKTMHYAMRDEIGEERFINMQPSYLYKGSILKLVSSQNSVWWDDLSTKDHRESRYEIVKKGLEETERFLSAQLGNDITQWKWSKVHTIEHVHPIGRKKPFDKLFNVGPFHHSSGNDVPNKMMYAVDGTGIYKTTSSPAMRIVLDFADVEASESVLPTGQSGNVMSDHYDDQTQLFLDGNYRPQLMNKDEIIRKSSHLILSSQDE